MRLQCTTVFYKISDEISISHVPAFMLTFSKKLLVVRNLVGMSMRGHRH